MVVQDQRTQPPKCVEKFQVGEWLLFAAKNGFAAGWHMFHDVSCQKWQLCLVMTGHMCFLRAGFICVGGWRPYGRTHTPFRWRDLHQKFWREISPRRLDLHHLFRTTTTPMTPMTPGVTSSLAGFVSFFRKFILKQTYILWFVENYGLFFGDEL